MASFTAGSGQSTVHEGLHRELAGSRTPGRVLAFDMGAGEEHEEAESEALKVNITR